MDRSGDPIPHDAATVAAVGALAAMLVVVNHEAIGHGAACLAVGGQPTLITTSLFRCSAASSWIDLGGPAAGFTLALVAALLTGRRMMIARPRLRLFLMLTAAFAQFWEWAYLAKAMIFADGDLYFARRGLVGEPDGIDRTMVAIFAATMFVGATGWTAKGLGRFHDGRRLARLAWVSGTGATVAAALIYRGGPGRGLTDTALEIGAASLPLLFIPWRAAGADAGTSINRSAPLIGLAVAAWVTFALTMGRGIGAP